MLAWLVLRFNSRQIVERFRTPVQLSPEQDLILLAIPAEARQEIEQRLARSGAQAPDQLEKRALACVALPLCGLAITEGERAMPDLLELLRQPLLRHDRLAQAPVFRVTGCANGCSRPYSAELALVGQAIGKYAIYAGGSPQGDRLSFLIGQRLSIAELPAAFDRLIGLWAAQGQPGESFGDFAARAGVERLTSLLQEAHS